MIVDEAVLLKSLLQSCHGCQLGFGIVIFIPHVSVCYQKVKYNIFLPHKDCINNCPLNSWSFLNKKQDAHEKNTNEKY